MTDNEIIEHLRNQKYSSALKGLYNILPDAKKYILNNSGTNDDARDIFQDALVILYKKVQTGDFTLTVPLKSYLFGIIRNCWLSELRLRKKHPSEEFTADFIDNGTPDGESYESAKAAFALLGEKCRQLLILFYFKKKSFIQIAAELSFSDDKVAKNQKYRCMQKAKEHYLTLSRTHA